ncbi:MAG: hypothetical protein LBE17_14770 [Treponema sp.]|jgi:hypothetical protein|nr:hypothetical protein [Treponema sp.]
MLAGRYAGPSVPAGELGGAARLRELKPRLYQDALTGELTAAPGALLLLYSSDGVIANRGTVSSSAPIPGPSPP